MDDGRRVFPHVLLADPDAFGNTGTEVLDQDIAARDKAHQHLDAVRVLEIDGDGSLVAVVVEIGRCETVFIGRHAARGIPAAGGVLDLDDIGALIGEQHGGGRSRHHAGQINDAHPVQCTWHRFQSLHPTKGHATECVNRTSPGFSPCRLAIVPEDHDAGDGQLNEDGFP